MLRIIRKYTLINQERFFFKNYYKDLLDILPVSFNENKDARHSIKQNAMIEFIKQKSNKDYNDMNKADNIFNQNILKDQNYKK